MGLVRNYVPHLLVRPPVKETSSLFSAHLLLCNVCPVINLSPFLFFFPSATLKRRDSFSFFFRRNYTNECTGPRLMRFFVELK
jgi:hypothetical protein